MTLSPFLDRPRGAAPLTIVIALAGVVLALLVTVSALAAYRNSNARRDWDEVLGSWDEIMQRYPATETNASALELERLAASLGIDITPRKSGRRDGFTDDGAAALEGKLSAAFYVYLKSQSERVLLGELDPPPPELTDFIAEHGEKLLALRRHLTRGDVAVWESDFSKVEVASLPASVALVRLQAGDSTGALADVEAAWNLSRSLRDSPFLINQLILIAGARMQLGVLRQIPDVDALWLDRLAEHDFREAFITAMKYEGWVWLYTDEAGIAREGMPVWKRIASPLIQPYTKLCLADLSDAWRERMVNLEQVDALCDRDLAPYGADLQIPLPRWNKLGELYHPNLSSAIGRLARLELDLELTRLWIVADAERRTNGGAWPEGYVGSRESDACPDDRWDFSVTGEGLEIALSRDVHWPDQKGTILPTSGVRR